MKTLEIISVDSVITTNNTNIHEIKEVAEHLLYRLKQLQKLSVLSAKDVNFSLDKEEQRQLELLLKALYLMTEREKEVLAARYLKNAELDYQAIDLLSLSNRQYYRIKSSAFLNYAYFISKLGLWALIKEIKLDVTTL